MFTTEMDGEYAAFILNLKSGRTKRRDSPDFYIRRKYQKDKAYDLAKKYYFNLLSETEIAYIKISTHFNKNFWVIRGYSEDEAKEKVFYLQSNNNKKRLEKYSKEELYTQTPTRIEYYLARGYSKEDGNELLIKRQSTFSLKKCIDKYGEEQGYIIWKERQDRWQTTLNSKSQEEIREFNRKKDSSSFSWALDKCGGNIGQAKQLFDSRCSKKDSSSFSWALDKCGGNIEQAKLLYKKRNSKLNKTHNYSYYSKESILYFEELYDFCLDLDLDILWKEKELRLIYDEYSFFCYDFCIPELNIIIEYHGCAFHPKIRDNNNWVHPFNNLITAEYIFDRDEKKKLLAIEKGYNYHIVWSDNKLGFIPYIKNEISEKYENRKNNIEKFI